MTKFTISDQNNGNIEFCEDATDAANTILTHDDYEYDIRREGDGEGFRLWISTASRNAYGGFKMVESGVFSLDNDRDKATAEIFAEVRQGVAGEAFGASASTYCQTLEDYISDLRTMIADLDDDDNDELEGLNAQLSEALKFQG